MPRTSRSSMPMTAKVLVTLVVNLCGIAPDVSNAPLHPCKPGLGLARISRAATLARECSAIATKLLQRYRMRLWTNDDFTSRKRGKCGHAEIKADFSFRLGYGLYIVSLDLQGNEPSSRFA